MSKNRSGQRSAASGQQGVLRLALLALLPLLLGGCNIGAAIGLMFYDPQEKAEYKLAKGPLLVVVEDYAGSGGDPTIRYHLTRTISDQLTKEGVNKQIIPDKTLWDFQKSHPVSARWDERKLGKELKAEQVVHVQMEPYIVAPTATDPGEYARLAATVRVIDVETGDQLWPLEGKGREVNFELPPADLHGVQPGAELKRDLAKGLGDKIAKLFYWHRLTDTEASHRAVEERQR
ncbi:MAG: hypothetical protein PHU85_19595 [Phycisphaerae bacterium]|nr:hypothetical protein [Phycisphaerae bacterium]